jgi:hypothetical protein
VQLFFVAPSDSRGSTPQVLRWTARERDEAIGTAEIAVYLEYDGVPQ